MASKRSLSPKQHPSLKQKRMSEEQITTMTTTPKKHIYVSFLGERSLVSCKEGELISRVLSYLKKKSALQQEVKKLEQEKSDFQQEVEKLKKQARSPAKFQLFMELNKKIGATTAGIRELNTHLEKLSTETAGVLDSSSDLVIYSGSCSEVDLSATVDGDLIESCSTWEKPLVVEEKFKSSLPVGSKFMEVEGERLAAFSSVLYEVNRSKKSLPYHSVPVYYHWFAVQLFDLLCLGDGEPNPRDEIIEELLEIKHQLCEGQVNTLIEELLQIKSWQESANKYSCTSLLQRALDRFFFQRESFKHAACLGQHSVPPRSKPDFLVYTLNNLSSGREILHSNYKSSDLGGAIEGTVAYYIFSNEDKETFSWGFGLPFTAHKMVFQMYLSANATVFTIDLANVSIGDTQEFKKFLSILYAAVHWRIKNLETPGKITLACEPIKGFVLRYSLASKPDSQRVFYGEKDNKVYKFYWNGGTAVPNYSLMKSMGYFKNLKLEDIGQNHKLLSYELIEGTTVPQLPIQIVKAKEHLETIHRQGYVHSDVRFGNIVFSLPDGAFLIDFDFAAKCDVEYHDAYNQDLMERHPEAKPGLMRKKEHDVYSLEFIADYYNLLKFL